MTPQSYSLVQFVFVALFLVSFSAEILEKLKRGRRVFTVNGCQFRGVVVHFRPSETLSDIEAIMGVPYADNDHFSVHYIFPRVNRSTICQDEIMIIKEATNFDFVCMQSETGNIGVVKDAKKRFYESLVYRLVHKREECHNLNLYIPYQGEY